MAADFRAREELVAGDVIAVMMSVDQTPDRLAAADLSRARDEILRGNRTLQRVDRQHVVRPDDQPRVRDARTAHVRPTALRVGVDVRRELPQFAVPGRRQRIARDLSRAAASG